MLEWQIDDLLERLAAQDERRITPVGICKQLGTPDLQAVTAYLLSQRNNKLTAQYEVEYPYGHCDFVVSDPTRIPQEPRYC